MPDMNKLIDFLIRQNPQVANNPQAKEWLDVIRNNDAARGQEIAKNICESYGTSVQDAGKQASDFFSQFKNI